MGEEIQRRKGEKRKNMDSEMAVSNKPLSSIMLDAWQPSHWAGDPKDVPTK